MAAPELRHQDYFGAAVPMHALLVDGVEVATASHGNFDPSPYERELIEFSYRASLYRLPDRPDAELVLRLEETKSQGDHVSNMSRVFHKPSADSAWREVPKRSEHEPDRQLWDESGYGAALAELHG
jgi:hypothetical protein